jgi:hypothetical protein
MSVLTIYNHGSGGSSLKPGSKGEIVNLFGNNDRSEKFIGKIITEGVGSIGDPDKKALFVDRDAKNGDYKGVLVTDFRGGAFASLGRLAMNIIGGGVDANVQTVLSIIKLLNLSGRRPDVINMLGWSRGAVTSNRIAYFLYNMQDPNLQSIPINIFNLDPVPGPGHNAEVDAHTITPNVKNYVSTYMLGERGAGFKPLKAIIVEPEVTKYLILPFRGNHSSGAKMETSEGQITFNLAARFLYNHGTDVSPMAHYVLSNADCWKLYEHVMLGRSINVTRAKATQQKAFSKPQNALVAFFGRGGVATRETVPTSDSDFFLNAHAKALFLAEFNSTFRAHFGMGKPSRNTYAWAAQWGADIVTEMKRLDPGVAHKLSLLGPARTSPGDSALGQNQVAVAVQNRLVD